MMPPSTRADSAGVYSPKEYWTDLAEGAPSTDVSGFAPVLHPNSPPWFNQLIDRLQFRAVRRALALGRVGAGESILDVGCGTGRWVRRYEALGLRATGVDATPSMLRLALERGTAAPLAAGQAQCLPFASEQFDAVSDITVVQHIPSDLQSQVLAEMARILRPGGRLILMELIRGQGAHVFPRTPRNWIQEASLRGLKLLGWFGQEYLLLDRLFVHTVQKLMGSNGGSPSEAGTSGSGGNHSAASRQVYWALRHVSASLSAWTDPLVETISPRKLATHGVFVFQK